MLPRGARGTVGQPDKAGLQADKPKSALNIRWEPCQRVFPFRDARTNKRVIFHHYVGRNRGADGKWLYTERRRDELSDFELQCEEDRMSGP